MFVEGGGRETG